MMDLSKYRELFLTESRENLLNLNKYLLALENDLTNVAPLNEIFRSFHTIKGMAASMGYQKIVDLTHQAEDLLDKFRKEELKPNEEVLRLLFTAVDRLESLVEGEDLSIDDVMKNLELVSSGEFGKLDIKEEAKLRKIKDIRITLDYLDTLMNIAGELVINKDRILKITQDRLIEELTSPLERLSRLVLDLQEKIMNIRMVPMWQVFDRFPRLIRDSSVKLGKEVDFVIEGKEIELDRSMLDKLTDPLIHLLRNSIDHGIESPQQREQLNKPRKGRLLLQAKRLKESVEIVVEDDGGGINPDEVLSVAKKRGIITDEEVEKLTPKEIFNLIADTRYSTKREVTEVSGRGVGLDIVKERLRALGGSLDINSTVGEWSRFTLRVPLTLAIIKALIAKVGDERYAIPFSQVSETININPSSDIKTVHNKEVMLLRGEVISLIRLSDVFEIPSNGNSNSVIVVNVEGKDMGIIVESYFGQQEIIVKSLGGILGDLPQFAGVTILGDGKPALILDVANII